MASDCSRGGVDRILGKFFHEMIIKHWSGGGCPVEESPSLQLFRGFVDVAFKFIPNHVSGSGRFTAGLGDLKGLF